MTLALEENWKDAILAQMPGFQLVDGIALDPKPLMAEPGYSDVDYTSILQDPFRSVTAEHPFYVAAVKEPVQKVCASRDSLVADLGCGDGRIVRELLHSGCQRIVGMDISRLNLARLADRLQQTPGASGKVLLVEGDVAKPCLPKDCFDLVMVIGVLFLLNDGYAAGLAACAELVRPGGYFLTVDPTEFGAAMYAIVRHDLVELGRVMFERTKTVDIQNPQAPRYSVRSVEEMVQAHETARLGVVSVRGVPLFPSLLFGGIKQMHWYDHDELCRMKQLNDMLIRRFPDSWRAACILSQRLPGDE